MRRSILAAALTLAALACCGATTSAAGASSFKMGLTVHNQTRYELRYVTTHAKNIDWWPQAPDVPASVGTVKPFSDSVAIRYISQNGGEDSWARVIYDAYDNGVKRGQVTYAVRVECSGGAAWDFGGSCWNMKRFTDGTTTLGDVALRWQDNGASPYSGYYGEMWAAPKSGRAAGLAGRAEAALRLQLRGRPAWRQRRDRELRGAVQDGPPRGRRGTVSRRQIRDRQMGLPDAPPRRAAARHLHDRREVVQIRAQRGGGPSRSRRAPERRSSVADRMGAVIHTTATNAGDSVKLMVAESYEQVVERLRAAAAAGGLAEVTQQHDGTRIALAPAHVVLVREPLK